MEGEQHNENFIHQFQLLKIPFIAIHQFLLKSDLSLNVQKPLTALLEFNLQTYKFNGRAMSGCIDAATITLMFSIALQMTFLLHRFNQQLITRQQPPSEWVEIHVHTKKQVVSS